MPNAAEPAHRPTKRELEEAVGRVVPDLVAKDLRVLFCGINPGLYSGATGHHFARPGNRFWKALYGSGFTDRLIAPYEERELLAYGLGITNLVNRTTARADELSNAELRAGGERLRQLVRRYRPRVLAVLGMGAYATAFGSRAGAGLHEPSPLEVPVFVLPNPSGLAAGYQLPRLVELFGELRAFVDRSDGARGT